MYSDCPRNFQDFPFYSNSSGPFHHYLNMKPGPVGIGRLFNQTTEKQDATSYTEIDRLGGYETSDRRILVQISKRFRKRGDE